MLSCPAHPFPLQCRLAVLAYNPAQKNDLGDMTPILKEYDTLLYGAMHTLSPDGHLFEWQLINLGFA